MECVNLYYLYTASKVNIKEFRSYEKILSNRSKITSLGDREKGSIYHLVDYLLANGCMFEKLNNFYYSYTIPHIGKEFDLLKISDDKILNIELKSEDVGLERIKTQLLRNYNYLKYLSKEMYLFTFISNTKEFYKLDENLNLIKTTVLEVLSVINSYNDDTYLDIDKLFKPSDYLISPNTSPLRFINNQYFLTTQQEYIKNKIINNSNNIFKITGEAGTGKTLLLFDIAKYYSEKVRVLIISCNKENPAHKVISEQIKNIDIMSSDDLKNIENNLKEYEYIFIDEAQRMNLSLFKKLTTSNKKIFFVLDPKQVLTKEEIKTNINNLIDKLNPVKFKLSNRIRINNSISSFTKKFFDLSTKNKLDLSCVTLCYASNIKELETYFNIHSNEYTYICSNKKYQNENINTVDILDVVGKDYENVLMILDSDFYYSKNRLMSFDSKNNDYLNLKILYQGLTRTRENVVLIIYRNKMLFKELTNNLI